MDVGEAYVPPARCFRFAQVSEVITSLVTAGALPPKDDESHAGFLLVADESSSLPQREVLAWLEEASYVECVEKSNISKWRLSQKGASSLEMVNCMETPRSIFSCPPALTAASYDEVSVYEIIRYLESKDWHWQELPRRQHDRAAIAYRLNDDSVRVWCSDKGRVCKAYLMCLALADSLLPLRGVDVLQHGRSEKEYVALLRPETVGRKSTRRLSLTADIHEDEEEQQAVVPAGGAHIVQEDGGNEADSSDFTDCLEALLMEEEIEEEWQQVLAQDRKALQRKEREMHRIAVQQSSRLNHTWGVFRFTLRRDGSGGQRFSWQIRCPYYRLNDNSGCKKGLSFQAVSPEDFKANSEACLLALRHWGNQALTTHYQAVHMAHAPSIVTCPPAAVVEAQKLKYFPRGKVPTDDDLGCRAAEPLPMHLWYPENEDGVAPQEDVPMDVQAPAVASSSEDDM